MLWALVPVKELTQSKQRLAGVLDPDEREGLVLAMLQDVLSAIREASVFDGVLLVSRSSKVQALAQDFVTDMFVESRGSDHSRAVTEANRYLIGQHRTRSSMAISGDIPRITAQDIHEVLAYHDRLSLVPNDTGEGTNAILASPPNVIMSQFGGPSLRRHITSADAAGLTPSIVRNKNIALDIDEPRDLARAVADLPASFTRNFLLDSGITERLNNKRRVPSTKPAPGKPLTVDHWI